MAPHPGNEQPHEEGEAGLLEQDAAVAVGVDAQRAGRVEEDRPAHDPDGEQPAESLATRNQHQHRGDDLDDADEEAERLLPARRAEPIRQDGEEVDRTLVAGQLELLVPEQLVGDPERSRPAEQPQCALETGPMVERGGGYGRYPFLRRKSRRRCGRGAALRDQRSYSTEYMPPPR